ncbi:hypothetical protein JCM10213v2_004993 [Rhodosporidiobolus nylandii]
MDCFLRRRLVPRGNGQARPPHLVQSHRAAEQRLSRKIDWHVLPPVALIYLFCFIGEHYQANWIPKDKGTRLTFSSFRRRPLPLPSPAPVSPAHRANIGNARLAGLERDLGLQGYDYNILLTACYVAYVVFVFDVTCQLTKKWMGPRRSIPLLSFCFGLLTFVVAYCPYFGSLVAVRFLLDIAEGAIFPGLALYLSRFYRKDELGFRLACYIVCAPLAGAFSGLLASGIRKLDPIGSHSHSIFFVERIISMGIAVICWFLMPNTPSACKWLSEDEKERC